MNSSFLWIFSVLVVTGASRVSSSDLTKCPSQCDCRPGGSGNYLEVTCPNPMVADSVLSVKYEAKDYVQMDCFPGVKLQDYQMLDSFKLGPVNSVMLKMCPMPASLFEMLDNLNVTGVKTLTVRFSNLTHVLNTRQFRGFTNVTRLVLTSSGASNLPEDFFQDFPNLTSLDMRGNDITELPLQFFHSIPKLRFLELGDNRITHLNPGVFQNLSDLNLLNLWKNNLQNLTREVFENLSVLDSLELHTNGLRSLPYDVFADLKALKTLSIMSNNFSTLPHNLFSETRGIEKLMLNFNRQRLTLPSGFLSNLANLKIVLLNSNNMSQLPEDFLWGCTSLETLQIQNNALTELPDAIFRDATSLQKLDISHNRLQTLSKETFSSLTKLEVLSLANNRLTDIPDFTFGRLAKLEELNLERNELSQMSSQLFASKCQLKRLRLSNNRLTFQRNQQIENLFEMSPLNRCLKLEEIYLANNAIEKIFYDWRNLMGKLATLDLKYNNITYIEAADLQFLVKKLVLDLRNNKIADVDLRLLEPLVRNEQPKPGQLVQSVKVLLKNNPLQCDCKTYDLLRYIEGNLHPEVYQFVELDTDGLNCSSPEELSGVSIKKLKSATITCELNKASMGREECPIPCKCYGRPEDKALIVDCTEVGFRRAPEKLPQLAMWRHTELHLERNWLRLLPNASLPGYHLVKKLYVSHNNLTRLERANIPPQLEVLELDHNNLTQIDTETLNFMANKTKLRLSNNPWSCNCDARDFLNFVQVHYKQVDMLQNVSCSDNRSLAQLSADDLCPVSINTIIAASVAIATLGIIIGAMAALYYRYQQEIKVWLYAHNLCLWFVTEEELDKDKHYDAFVSYSHKDEEFVVNKLVPGLESGPTPFKLCLHFRDWIAGDWIPNQIARSVEDSRRTMVILSPNFLESVWGRMEFRAAHSQALSEGRARVIVVLYGDVGPIEELDPELRAYLSMNTYVKWGDPWFWDKLRYALPHPPELVKRARTISKQPELRIKTGFDDKLELMVPVTPDATTPPADKIINPMIDANGHIITSLTSANGRVKLLKETNGHANGYVKSI